LTHSGISAARTPGKSGDNGIDGVIVQEPLGVDQTYVKAKRYAAGSNICGFFGVLNLKKA